MRRLRVWDAVAALAVLAIAVPYIGYLWHGSMPFIQDPRGMAGTGLVLGVVAFAAALRAAPAGRVEVGMAVATLVLGFVALALAETFAAEVLLAVFMGAILVTWAAETLRHAGLAWPVHHGPSVTR